MATSWTTKQFQIMRDDDGFYTGGSGRDNADSEQINNLINAYRGNQVITGLEVTAQTPSPTLSVDIADGSVYINSTIFALSSITPEDLTSLVPAVGGESNFTIIYVDSAGAIQTIAGTDATTGNQFYPEIPENSCPIAVVLLTNADSQVNAADIGTMRMEVADGLYVGGLVEINAGTDNDVLFLEGTHALGVDISFQDDGTRIRTKAGDSFKFILGSAVKLSINNDGTIKNPVDNAGFYTGASDQFRMYYNSTNGVIVASSGDIIFDTGAERLNIGDTGIIIWDNIGSYIIRTGQIIQWQDADNGDVPLFSFDTSARTLTVGAAADFVNSTFHGNIIAQEHTAPTYRFKETDGGVDNKIWETLADGEQLLFRARNDALDSSQLWLAVDRTGITIDTITFPSGNVGIGVTPSFHTEISDTNNAITGTDVDISELSLVLNHSADATGSATGLGFGISTVHSNIGGAIIFERTGSNSQGQLHFATKSTTVEDEDVPIRMTIDKDGNVGIGGTPTSTLHVFGDFDLAGGGTGVVVDIIRDEDDMVSDDVAALVTQQSVKAYVDAAELIGEPNAQYIGCAFVGLSSSVQSIPETAYLDNTSGLVNIDSTNYISMWYLAGIPYVKGGKNLYIGGCKITIAASDGSNHIDRRLVRGMDGTLTATDLDTDTSIIATAGIDTDTFTAILIGGVYQQVEVDLSHIVATVNLNKISSVELLCHYA